MRLRDWSSDVCSSDLRAIRAGAPGNLARSGPRTDDSAPRRGGAKRDHQPHLRQGRLARSGPGRVRQPFRAASSCAESAPLPASRSEEHTSELQSLMRISYAVFCLKKKNHKKQIQNAE